MVASWSSGAISRAPWSCLYIVSSDLTLGTYRKVYSFHFQHFVLRSSICRTGKQIELRERIIISCLFGYHMYSFIFQLLLEQNLEVIHTSNVIIIKTIVMTKLCAVRNLVLGKCRKICKVLYWINVSLEVIH